MAKKDKKKVDKKKKEDISGLFVPAGLLIGMGIGFMLENLVAWLFIGLGSGFLCMAISKLLMK